MFKIGQKIISLVTFGNIVKGEIYVVQNVRYCMNCGVQSVCIGDHIQLHQVQYCRFCRKYYPISQERFYSSSRFAPVEEISDTTVEQFLETISEVNHA